MWELGAELWKAEKHSEERRNNSTMWRELIKFQLPQRISMIKLFTWTWHQIYSHIKTLSSNLGKTLRGDILFEGGCCGWFNRWKSFYSHWQLPSGSSMSHSDQWKIQKLEQSIVYLPLNCIIFLGVHDFVLCQCFYSWV